MLYRKLNMWQRACFMYFQDEKYDDGKQLHDEISTHGNKYNEQGSIRHGHTEKDWKNFDSLNDGSGDGKGNAYTSESSRTSMSNHEVSKGNQKSTSLKDKLQCFIKPSKVNDVPHLYQATTSQSFGDGKSLEKSIERLKNPSINTVSNELHSSTIKTYIARFDIAKNCCSYELGIECSVN